jgi:hypothetical protein
MNPSFCTTAENNNTLTNPVNLYTMMMCETDRIPANAQAAGQKVDDLLIEPRLWKSRKTEARQFNDLLGKQLVGERGFEPPTPWSRTRCSTRLSHSPTKFVSLREEEGKPRHAQASECCHYNIRRPDGGLQTTVRKPWFACLGEIEGDMKNHRSPRKYRITGDDFRGLPGLRMPR